jgi:hypothetical protein
MTREHDRLSHLKEWLTVIGGLFAFVYVALMVLALYDVRSSGWENAHVIEWTGDPKTNRSLHVFTFPLGVIALWLLSIVADAYKTTHLEWLTLGVVFGFFFVVRKLNRIETLLHELRRRVEKQEEKEYEEEP